MLRNEVGQIFRLNRSPGGVPKLPIDSAMLTPLGLEGDDHNDKRDHGGPERALCFYSVEQIQALQAEGHPAEPGTLGENITTIGIDLTRVETGDQFQLGASVVVEVTRFTTPCKTIVESFADRDVTRIHQRIHPGSSRFYTRVINGGLLRVGDPIRKLTSDEPRLDLEI